MTGNPGETPKLPLALPLPYSLADHRGIRRELVSLYRQAKKGLIPPQLLGRLTHLLATLAAIDRDIAFEARLRALEEAAAADPHWPRPDGSAGGRYATH